MSIELSEVKKIAHLASLAINDEQAEALKRDFNNILKLVDQMAECDISETEAMAHPVPATQPLRPDVITETNQRGPLQAIAPETKAGLYIVPQFVETN